MKTRPEKIASGYYRYRGATIEAFDRMELPGRGWRIVDEQHKGIGDAWIGDSQTLSEAVQAIDATRDEET